MVVTGTQSAAFAGANGTNNKDDIATEIADALANVRRGNAWRAPGAAEPPSGVSLNTLRMPRNLVIQR